MAIKSFCDICGRVDENPSLKIEVYEKSKLSSAYLRNNPGNESVLSYIKRLFGGKR